MSNHDQTREAWLHAVAKELGALFAEHDATIPSNIRISCGWPSVKGLASKHQRIGECWSETSSADGHHEIFVSPILSDATRVTGVLAHELIHATVGNKHGHKAPFKRLALAIGLEGKMTATTEGPAFIAAIEPILARVGPYPHAELRAMSNGRAKQTTRLLKVECEECGYTARVTAKWLDDVGAPHCPLHGEMQVC